MGALRRFWPQLAVAAIDIPIGLTARGPRACDVAARRLLGRPRASSVFPAPIRPALSALTRAAASRITARLDGRGVGTQAWNLYARIREVDVALRTDARLRALVYESHPEISFRAIHDGRTITSGKKTGSGRRQRERLVERHFGRGCVGRIRRLLPRAEVATDDILDAFAVLWTAARIHAGIATALPAVPACDPCGLPMRIVI